ncbi:MAG: response regulator [Lachnospiraceae bacterium]|nr:response regulator [Lachnospiraceae bacterium]
MIRTYIADDEIWVVLGLQKQLEKTGLPIQIVGTANNGLTAKEEIGKLQPDIVFTDIRMPGENGLELLRDIGDLSEDSRVVIISGYEDFQYAREAIRNHAYEYLVKPINQEELLRVIHSIQREIHPEETEIQMQEEVKALRSERATDIDKVVEEIRDHFTENISLTSLAKKYGMSSANLSAQLKDKLQMTFSDYLTSLRIQNAKQLLKNPNVSVQTVAEESGYPDYFYFTKVFKKVEGISPSKYRKELEG